MATWDIIFTFLFSSFFNNPGSTQNPRDQEAKDMNQQLTEEKSPETF